MKRVLCLVSAMNAGGAETYLMKLYRAIDKTKYQMDFCVNIKTEGLYDKEIESLGGKIFHIPSKSESLSGFKKGLGDIIKNEGYKYVLRVTSNAAGFMDLKIAKKAGAEICSARSSNSSDGGSVKSVAAHKLGRLLYNKYVDVKFAPSDLAAKYTFGEKAYNNGKVTILHNAIDLNTVCYNKDGRKRIRNEFNIDDNTNVLCHIGRFAKQKNHCFLLQIFKEYLNIFPDSVLLMVGDGELKEQIKALALELGIDDKTVFLPVRSDIPDVLSAADAFVFPSLYEGMPNTVIEAQATGLPCIISDTITKEADITGLVTYKSLNDTAEMWALQVKEAIPTRCTDSMKEKFTEAVYDIQSASALFTHLVFNE